MELELKLMRENDEFVLSGVLALPLGVTGNHIPRTLPSILAFHADMVWRIVNLKKSATLSPVVYGGSVCVDTANRNEK